MPPGVGEVLHFKLKKEVQEDGNGSGVQRVTMAVCPVGEALPFCLIIGSGRWPPAVRKDVTHWGGACCLQMSPIQIPSREVEWALVGVPQALLCLSVEKRWIEG